MHNEEREDKDASPHHQLGAGMGLAFAGLMVTHRAGQTVGEPEPRGEADVQSNETEQHYLKDLHNVVGAHEMAERAVPGTVVVPQDAEVGTGVEQQEDEQESAQQGDTYLLGDGMDFG